MTFSQLCAMGRSGSITVSVEAWTALIMSLSGLRLYDLDGNSHDGPHDHSKEDSFVFHGPHGRIKVTYDPSLPAGEHIWTSNEAGYAPMPRGGFRECRVCGAPGQGDVCEYCRTRRESPKPRAHASVDAFNQWSRSSPLRSCRWPA